MLRFIPFIFNNGAKFSFARYNSNNDCIIAIIARNGLTNELNLDISGLPFQDMNNLERPNIRKILNYGRNTISPEDMQDNFGLILTAYSPEK